MTESPLRNLPTQSAVPREQRRADIHLGNETVLVDGAALGAVRLARRFGPHLLDVLEHHVAVAVKGLDAGEQLAVVAARDQNLVVRAHRRLEYRKRAGRELVLLELSDLVLGELGAGLVDEGGHCGGDVECGVGGESWELVVVAMASNGGRVGDAKR